MPCAGSSGIREGGARPILLDGLERLEYRGGDYGGGGESPADGIRVQ